MKILKRHAMPGKFHWEEYLSQWHFEKASGNIVIYIQISTNERRPRWVRSGSIFEVAMKDNLKDEEFVEKCITKYKAWLDCSANSRDIE